MKEGKPVLWLFVGVIIVLPLIYVWELHEAYHSCKEVIEQQNDTILEQKSRLEDLSTVNQVMYNYIMQQQQYPLHYQNQINPRIPL